MRRPASLLLVVLCVDLLTASVDAQLRLRRRSVAPIAGPSLSILIPTSGTTYQATSSPLTISGSAADVLGINRVSWSNAATGGSGTATGTTDWTVTSAAAQTVFQDSFTESSDTALASHTPSPTGTSWTERLEPGVANNLIVAQANDQIRASANNTTGGAVLLYEATPATAISGTNYDVAITIRAVGTASGQAAAILFRYSDTSNYCAAVWYPPNVSTDMFLVKRVAGTTTTLDSGNVGPVVGDTIKVQVRGSSLTVLRNDLDIGITAADSFCDDAVGVGVGIGDVRRNGVDVIQSAIYLDDVVVVDQDASVGGITLNAGTNVITVTARNTANVTTAVQITVTYNAGTDTSLPVVAIEQPTAGTTYTTSTSAITVTGTCTDNIACTAVSVACATCTPTNPSNTGTAGAFQFIFTAQTSGANVITVTGVDAAANSGQDLLTSTYTPADVTNPTVTITTNGGAGAGVNFTTSTAAQTLEGTCADNVVCTDVSWSCTLTSPASGPATGTASWSTAFTLGTGANVCTVTGRDEAGNVGTDTITITFTGTLTITTTVMSPATQNVAYSQTLAVTGGTAPYTWDNNSGGSSLGAAACTGLSISSAGVVSGTPTTTGTCNFTAKVTDNAAATDTQALAIVVSAAGSETAHEYFTTLIARGDCLLALSLRPVESGASSKPSGCENPHYRNQLKTRANGGYASNNSRPLDITYDVAGDTDPNKQDAAKEVHPQFTRFGKTTLTTSVNSAETTWTLGTLDALTVGMSLKIDTEVVTITQRTLPFTAVVARAQFGTSAASHTAGTDIYASTNNLQNQIIIPFSITDGNSVLVTWDVFPTASYMNIGGALSYKRYMFFSGNGGEKIWLEPRWRMGGQTGTNVGSPSANCAGWNASIYAGGLDVRTYMQAGGVDPWTLEQFMRNGPNVVAGNADTLAPQANSFCFKPNVWLRYWMHLTVVANDWDIAELWVADEQRDPVKLIDAREINVQANGGVQAISGFSFWSNSSNDNVTRSDLRNLDNYLRNWVALLNPAADWATDPTIMKKPVR